jgi:hypothetical protein
LKKRKKIAKGKLQDLEVIYFEVDNALIKEFPEKEERKILKDKNALFKDWNKVDELDILTNE